MTPDARAALHALCFEVPRPWEAAEFGSLLRLPYVFAIDVPGGFAIGRVVAGEAELLTIAVAPEQRRQGIGLALLHGLEQEALRREGTEIFLEVSAENTAALALYEAAGYRSAGLRKEYYRTPDGHRSDALILRKTLSCA